jgi:TetR/AcrR family transcriptional regulator
MVDKDSKSKLIEAALPLFAIKGYAAVSIRELAEAAGVNVALINYHFGGKESLYEAVVKSQLTLLVEVFNKEKTANLTPMERVGLFGKNLVTFHQRSPYLRRLISSELSNPTPCFDKVIKKHIRMFFPTVQVALTDGISEKDFRSDFNPTLAAIAVAGMIHFYFLAQPVVNDLMPPYDGRDEEYLQEVLSIYFQGISRKEGEIHP